MEPLSLGWIVVILRQSPSPFGRVLNAEEMRRLASATGNRVSMLPQLGVSYYTWLVDDSFEDRWVSFEG
jgi:hypothetical protein